MPRGRVRQTNIDKRIEKVFTTPGNPGSFGGLYAVYREVNRDGGRYIPITRVKKWLITNRAFSIHRQPKRKFRRRKVITSGPNIQFQADLIDMQELAEFNDGYRYILTVIDVFSKFSYAVPLKSKHGEEVVRGFQLIKSRGAVLPKILQTDKGKEFLNDKFKEWCKKNRIKMFSSEDDQMKASIVERYNSTLENKLSRMMSHFNTNVWLDELDEIVFSINHSYNSSIRRTPASVNYENMSEVFFTLYPPPVNLDIPSKRSDTFKIGQHVRLLHAKKSDA